MSEPQITSNPQCGREMLLQTLAAYRAFVRLDLEFSEITMAPAVTGPFSAAKENPLLRALAKPPEWAQPLSWPPKAKKAENAVLLTLLVRWKALFDFGSRLPGQSAAELKAAIAEWFQLGSTEVPLPEAARFKRFPVDAAMFEDGSTTWGFSVPEEGVYPLGVSPDDATSEGQRPSLDRFIQEHVRADLQQRIEDLEGTNL